MATRKSGVLRLLSVTLGGITAGSAALAALHPRKPNPELQRELLDQQRELIGQQRELLDHLRSQHHHARLIAQQQLQLDLLEKVLRDPSLAAVFDLHEGEASAERRRQYLVANAMYTNALLAWRIETITKEGFLGFVRGMLQNPVFREYWDATRKQRLTLDDSDEARMGREVDELAEQLDESESDEWWVVGRPGV